jgi:Flp pilus assembly protein TadD
VQALLGGATAAMVAVVARRLGGVRTGWLAGAVYALYGPVVLVETSMLAEGLLVFLLTLALLILTGQPLTLAAAGLAGAALGAATLVRPTALLMAVACAVWLLLRRPRASRGQYAPIRSAVLALAAAFGLVVAPALWKNWSGSGSFGLQGYGGLNFYIGNSPLHDGRATFRLGAGWDALNSEAPRAGIRDPVAQDRYYVAKALGEIGRYPLQYLQLLGLKSLWLVQAEESRDSHSFYFFADQSALLRWLPGFGAVFPLALAGAMALAGWPKRPPTGAGSGAVTLVALYAVGAAASVVLLVAGFRYRMPLVPILALAAGVGVDAVLAAVADRRVRDLIAYAAAAVVGFAVSHAVHDARDTNVAEEWALTGSALITERKLTDAEAAYRRALELEPRLGLAWDGLGLVFYDAGRLADARPAFGRALEIDPDSARATFHLALVRDRAGELEAAAAGYNRALSLSPFDAEIAEHLAQVERKYGVQLGMAGRTAEARDAIQRALALRPDDGEAWVDLCLLLLDLGDRDGAARALERGRERGAGADRVAFAADALARQR